MSERPPIPVEEVARLPAPGMAGPVSFAFSPDDAMLTYLWDPGGGLTRRLYGLDVATGERRMLARAPDDGDADDDEVPLEEALRRERHREVGAGITRYAWARRADRILVPLDGGVYVTDSKGGALREVIGPEDGPAIDPKLSPDGSLVAFVRDDEVYVASVEGGEARQLTSGARGTGRTHGLAEFVAQEEMGRSSGHWWSGDGAWLALTEVDETRIPAYRIVHQGSDAVGEEAEEEHRYPFAGGPNALVRLGVIPVAGGEVRWLDTGEDDCYLARVHWMPDGAVVAQVEDRTQTRLDLVRFDPPFTGPGTVLLSETTDVWINLHDMFRPLEERGTDLEGGFVWASERSGFRHLEVRDRDGALVGETTAGDWMVDRLHGLDEAAGLVCFSATRDGPTERHMYVAPITGGEPRRITAEPGMHDVVVDHGCRFFVDVHSSSRRQPWSSLRSLPDGEAIASVHDEPDERVQRLGLSPPELVELTAGDGTTLHAALYRPATGAPPHPTVVSVYGGPHVQKVTDGWGLTADMRAQHLCHEGFLVVVLDNRGSARRGLAFESAVGGDLGNLEVRDQVEGVTWLVEQGLADPDRVGIYGWSYGGYLAAMSLGRSPGTFAAAVAGAPVTHWDGYDTHYTERYMGTPEANPDGYERSSVMHHAAAMEGSLLIVHGLLDENVHFRHTARLLNALIRHRVPYELLLLPDERHMPRKEEDRLYMEQRVTDFFLEQLTEHH